MAPESPGTVLYRVQRLEQDEQERKDEVKGLGEKVDRLILAVVGAALTFAVSVSVFAITLIASKGKT